MGRLIPGLGDKEEVDLNKISRATIEKFGAPIMRATVPARGLDMLLSIREQHGNLVTWRRGRITFTFRDGVLIESRGLGPDLMSAKAPAAAALAKIRRHLEKIPATTCGTTIRPNAGTTPAAAQVTGIRANRVIYKPAATPRRGLPAPWPLTNRILVRRRQKGRQSGNGSAP
ncbi:MAG: YjbF family lipoprotein [Paracoccaceae bacterium]